LKPIAADDKLTGADVFATASTQRDGKDHTYWSLLETVRTVGGPRQKTLCYLGELNGSAQARWLKSVEVFNEQAEALQSADIVLPTTDGREIRLRRIIEPRRNRNPHCIDSALSLPERLKSLSKCSVDFAIA
jgi:hypothetical protein